MLYTEFNLDEAKEVWHEEGYEEGIEEIARNALAKGYPVEEISDITGLDLEKIKLLSQEKLH